MFPKTTEKRSWDELMNKVYYFSETIKSVMMKIGRDENHENQKFVKGILYVIKEEKDEIMMANWRLSMNNKR
jgi:hypothetical protein